VSCGVSANEYSCAHHVTWSPNKLWRSTSIFNICLQDTVNCSYLCSLHFVMLITNAKPRQNSVLNPCDMESSQMPLPGSSISATYLFKNKLRALNTLLKRAEYNIISERAFLFPCLKTLHGHSNRWTLSNHHKPSCGLLSSFSSTLVSSVAERSENLVYYCGKF
jgi:hypothetical protein